MKRSEARILIYLKNSDLPFCYAKQISRKLDMDYAYCRDILCRMVEKSLLSKHFEIKRNKAFYNLTTHGNNKVKDAQKLVRGLVEEEE